MTYDETKAKLAERIADNVTGRFVKFEDGGGKLTPAKILEVLEADSSVVIAVLDRGDGDTEIATFDTCGTTLYATAGSCQTQIDIELKEPA